MKEKNDVGKILLLELLFFVGWCVAVILLTNFAFCGFNFWFAFCGTVFSFVVACVSFLTIKKTTSYDTTEASVVPIVTTGIYLIGAILFNNIFIFGLYVFLEKILVISNILWFIVFIAVRLFVNNYINRLDNQTKIISQKFENNKAIAANLSILLSNDMDSDIKSRVLKLKEMVDYSTNITSGYDSNYCNAFLSKLNQIDLLIKQNASKEQLIKEIGEAESIWKARNGVLASTK